MNLTEQALAASKAAKDEKAKAAPPPPKGATMALTDYNALTLSARCIYINLGGVVPDGANTCPKEEKPLTTQPIYQ